MKKVLTKVLLAASVVLLAAGLALSAPIGKFTFKTADGKDVKNDNLKGKKTMFIVSQTACAQCKNEMLEMQTMYEDLKKIGDVYVVLVDQATDRAVELYNKRGYPFPVLLDPDFNLSTLADIEATPATVILDPNLEIKFKKVGFKAGQGAEIMDEFKK